MSDCRCPTNVEYNVDLPNFVYTLPRFLPLDAMLRNQDPLVTGKTTVRQFPASAEPVIENFGLQSKVSPWCSVRRPQLGSCSQDRSLPSSLLVESGRYGFER